MVLSFLKSSFRNIVSHRLFSIINIIGFAVSMSIGLLLIAILFDAHDYDSFHEKKDQIYRVISTSTDSYKNVVHLATTSVKAAKRISETIPYVENVGIVRNGFGGDFEVGDKSIQISNGLWVEQSFLNIFSFQLLRGNEKTALKEPFSIVLTEESAKRLFGEIDPVGKTITLKNNGYAKGNGPYLITGIMKDIPKLSHLQFDALGSFSTLEILEKENDEIWQWENIWSNFVYIILPKGKSLSSVQSDLNRLSTAENSVLQDDKIKVSLQLQPIKDIVLEKSLENEFSKRIPLKFIRILIILSVLVLLSAFFNYSNLSVARSLQRSHEIAIRKLNGAKRNEVLTQFIVEAILVAIISLVLALVLFINLRPMFFIQFPDMSSRMTLYLSPLLIIFFIIFGVVTGLIAGILPGIYFSKVSVITAIKKIPDANKFPLLNMRKGLIVIQYVLSLIFITSTLIFLKQYSNFVNYDLGFNTSNILNIRVQGNNPEVLEKELSNLAEVSNTSKSFMVTSIGNNYFVYVKYNNLQDSVRSWYNIIDEKYIPLHDFKLKYGRNFIQTANNDVSEVIANEKLIAQLNIGNGNTESAIGKYIEVDNQKLQIVGIVDDFHYSTLDRTIGPFMFRYSNKRYQYINAKVNSSDFSGTMGKIQDLWKKIDPVHQLEALYYKDQIKRAYSQYESMARLIGFLAVLEILIASIGLLGMVVFSTEIRLKEIGVRKVMGAELLNLVNVLGRGFSLLILFSSLIALPIVYIIFEKVVLREIAYHSPIGAYELFSGTLMVIIVSMLIIVTQVYRIVRTNPTEILRNE